MTSNVVDMHGNPLEDFPSDAILLEILPPEVYNRRIQEWWDRCAYQMKRAAEYEARYIKERNDHIQTRIERDRLRMRVELYEIGADERNIDLRQAQAENTMLKSRLRKRTWSIRRALVNLCACMITFYFTMRFIQLLMFVIRL